MNEKENTFRILAEKPVLITSIWCYFGIHSWSQWIDDTVTSEFTSNRYYQFKHCRHCNKKIRRNAED